jgi:putative colanic acid biosynthesis UDP-glucose lipid carrier transferase
MPARDALIEKRETRTSGRTMGQACCAGVAPARRGTDLLSLLPGLLATADWLGIAVAGFAANKLISAAATAGKIHPLAILLAATLTVDFICLFRGYSIRNVARLSGQCARAAMAWLASIVVLAGIGWLVERSDEFFSSTGQFWCLAALTHLAGARSLVHWRIRHWQRQGLLSRKVAVLGSGVSAVRLAHRLSKTNEADLVGVFVDGEVPAGLDGVSGNTDVLVSLAAAGVVDEVIVASPWDSASSMNCAIGKFAALQTVIKLEPGLSELRFAPLEFGFVADVPTLTLQRRPLLGWAGPAKRVEDVALSLVLVILLFPLLLTIAILVKLDSPGPFIFRQERFGFNNNRFTVFKFRSMHHDLEQDPRVPQARRNDPRVTRIGGILRRTSLDELPQLFNVLLGDMSLVGPRPHAAEHNEKYAALIDGYLARHRMKPGITGWAQVNGARGETESPHQMKRRLEYDLSYIANWSLFFDFKVLIMTVPTVLRGTNAY